MNSTINHLKHLFIIVLVGLMGSCSIPGPGLKKAHTALPGSYKYQDLSGSRMEKISWRAYFDDPKLSGLIDTALSNNQELNIVLQELKVRQNEVLEKSGEYLPQVKLEAGAGVEKSGRYTRMGSLEHNLEIKEGEEFPEPLGDFQIGPVASWEVDIWRKLRNAKDAAQLRYLAANQGKNLLITNLIAEIASEYYELQALDTLLEIIKNNLSIQEEALRKVKLQKLYARTTQLAVNRFQAQLLKTKNLQYGVKQQIVETRNRLNFLVGRYSGDIGRNKEDFLSIQLDSLETGIPSDLLEYRPDIRQAAYQLQASKLDVRVARAEFYPSLDITAGIGFEAFKPSLLFNPESLLYNAAGEIMAPLINKKAIRARYNQASALQVQAVFEYERAVLNAYTEVLNKLNKLDNYSASFKTKKKEVAILNESFAIANTLFKYAEADYVEVLLTQEEALDAKMELVETKLHQLQAKINLYRALGGGWQ
ncbi:NodT family efflux transporter outer membrane factor (OMF) lipoprotein [Salegentibacter sp. 24]|uniref:TolC family protein n=1 Tax=Salegentibacter sp. 24 TaxID=2183986 RepID=UPI00105D6B21|nr:TolC family protein [Salegentibacter sp. 24]TDN94974.1 NodT family efflux transporter outer membrane factor (OMF) lipoprotein [Salegentibacter sp. 24]